MCVFGSTISADILTEPNLQDMKEKREKITKTHRWKDD